MVTYTVAVVIQYAICMNIALLACHVAKVTYHVAMEMQHIAMVDLNITLSAVQQL